MTNDDTKKNLPSKSKDNAQNASSTQSSDAVVETVIEKVIETKSGSKGLTIFAILLALLGIGGSGYNWYNANIKAKLDQSDLAVGVAQIGGQISRIGDTVASLQKQQDNVVSQEQLTTKILESNSAFDLRFRDVDQSQKVISESVDKINQSLGRSVNKFVIDEVSQLLKLANNNVLFSSDTVTAINALKLADLQLKELSDPRYSVVRKKINEEIGVLEAVTQVDVESVSVKLASLAKRIPSLKLENDVPILGEEDITLDVDEKSTSYKESAKAMVNDLLGLVKIQKIEQAPKPLLAPEQRYFLDQNIQLQLAKAELSLAKNRGTLYKDSLIVADTWLNDYFDTDNAEVVEVRSQITELKKVQLGQDLPSISGSYTLLQSIKGGK